MAEDVKRAAGPWECDKRQEGVPCRCPAWRELVQEGTADGSIPSKVVRGCHYDLFEWMISGAIRSNNRATAEASSVREDVQRLTAEVTRLKETLAGMGSAMRLLAFSGAAPELMPLRESAGTLVEAGDRPGYPVLPAQGADD